MRNLIIALIVFFPSIAFSSSAIDGYWYKYSNGGSIYYKIIIKGDRISLTGAEGRINCEECKFTFLEKGIITYDWHGHDQKRWSHILKIVCDPTLPCPGWKYIRIALTSRECCSTCQYRFFFYDEEHYQKDKKDGWIGNHVNASALFTYHKQDPN